MHAVGVGGAARFVVLDRSLRVVLLIIPVSTKAAASPSESLFPWIGLDLLHDLGNDDEDYCQ